MKSAPIFNPYQNAKSVPIFSPEELGVNRVETGINCKRLCFGIIRTEILHRVT